MAHLIVCRDMEAVHLATQHVLEGTVVITGGAGDRQALLCFSFNCVVISTIGTVPLHMANHPAVLSSDALRDARVWKRGWRKLLMSK